MESERILSYQYNIAQLWPSNFLPAIFLKERQTAVQTEEERCDETDKVFQHTGKVSDPRLTDFA